MALADRYDGFLVDLDGVVWIGRDPVPGSVETLERLLEDGRQLVFVTNNPGRPAGQAATDTRARLAFAARSPLMKAWSVQI